MSRTVEPRSNHIDWLAWWQLLRAANVFTAASNVIAGFLLVQRDWQPLVPLLLLIASSVLLYEGGMVLNDVCDAELDAIERPERPIPSGRVNKGRAYVVAVFFLGLGLFAATVAMAIGNGHQSHDVASALAIAVIIYDAFAKSTPLGPFVMGSCRALNVLLGASLAESFGDHPAAWVFAVGVGVYTMGITLFAAQETESNVSHSLLPGITLILAGLCVVLFLPLLLKGIVLSRADWIALSFLLLLALGNIVHASVSLFARHDVRGAVSTLIQTFIVLDALASTLAMGWVAGALVLSLLVPTRLLARQLPMT